MSVTFKVIVVGAGPGGLSTAAALIDAGLKPSEVMILEKGEIGEAWLDYPQDTHLLSESSPDHDDNMIAGVKTAEVFPHIPHPSHIMYQKYLAHVAEVKKIQVQKNTTVQSVVYNPEQKLFWLDDTEGREYTCQFLIWAAGMFCQPNEEMDSQGCYIHYARVPYLHEMSEPEVTVVGSANGASGVLLQLARPGRVVTLVTSRPYVVPQPIDCLWKEHMQLIKDFESTVYVQSVFALRASSSAA